MLKKMWKWLRGVLKPQVVLPVLLAAALLVFALSLGDVSKVMARLTKLSLYVLGISLAGAAAYLACKALQLRMMLTRVGVRIPAKPFWLAFAVGEMTVTLPLGLFSQNWIMSASRRIHVGRSSAATVMMMLVEMATVFLFLAVVGVPGWGYVRWASLGLLALFVLAVAAALFFEDKARKLPDRLKREWLKKAAATGLEMLDNLRKLCTPTTIGVSLVLAAIYLGGLTVAFWQVGRGMDVHHLDYLTATTIYMFSLAVILIGAGLLSQIGTVEILGMVVARAWGIGYTDGLAMMLGFRIVWTCAIWLLCLPIVASTWRVMPSFGDDASTDRGKKVSN